MAGNLWQPLLSNQIRRCPKEQNSGETNGGKGMTSSGVVRYAGAANACSWLATPADLTTSVGWQPMLAAAVTARPAMPAATARTIKVADHFLRGK